MNNNEKIIRGKCVNQFLSNSEQKLRTKSNASLIVRKLQNVTVFIGDIVIRNNLLTVEDVLFGSNFHNLQLLQHTEL